MPDDFPPVRVRFRWLPVLGWGLIVALVALGGWSGWREYDHRAAVREAEAAGLRFKESPTPFARIRADWHAAFRLATWTELDRELYLPEGTDLAPLRPLLVRLDPTFLSAIQSRNIGALRGLTRLRGINLGGSDVKDLALLAALTQLHKLSLGGCAGVNDLAPLAALTQLQELWINDCEGVANLAPLAGLTHLRQLSLYACTGVTDLSPLANLPKLQTLDLGGCTALSAEAVEAFKKGHPQTDVQTGVYVP